MTIDTTELRNAIERQQRIRQLNDLLRTRFIKGVIVLTPRVQNLDPMKRVSVLNKVRNFTAFTQDDDPRGEHDFGAFEFEGEKIFWKIEVFDRKMEYASPDPADSRLSKRVLTIMFANEY